MAFLAKLSFLRWERDLRAPLSLYATPAALAVGSAFRGFCQLCQRNFVDGDKPPGDCVGQSLGMPSIIGFGDADLVEVRLYVDPPERLVADGALPIYGEDVTEGFFTNGPWCDDHLNRFCTNIRNAGHIVASTKMAAHCLRTHPHRGAHTAPLPCIYIYTHGSYGSYGIKYPN